MTPITTYRIAGLVFLLAIAVLHHATAQCPDKTKSCESVYMLPIAHKANERHIIELKASISSRFDKTLVNMEGCRVLSQHMALIKQALDTDISNQQLYYEASQNTVLRQKIAGIVKKRAGSEARSFIIPRILSEGAQSYRFVADIINISDDIGNKEAVIEYSFSYKKGENPRHVLDGLEHAILVALGQLVALPVRLYPASLAKDLEIFSSVPIAYTDTAGLSEKGKALLYFKKKDIIQRDSLGLTLTSDGIDARHMLPVKLSGCRLPTAMLQLYTRSPLRIRHRISPAPDVCDQLTLSAVRYDGMH
ncbi:MAG: hypothetical protein WBG62_15395, partial [Cyclobacteriaceae bacterium]